ncbi:hypothetical protein [Nocardioides jensenii]|uniref:hypothetical protein n=1 Tax=Nocardioides jensenii TaxID=1843 RepID=UPI00082A0FC6|nr:hypothetical protein [Nocardioides jensenii]
MERRLHWRRWLAGGVRLVERGRRTERSCDVAPGLHLFSNWLGAGVFDESGHRLGWFRDLVTDLVAGAQHPPVTHVVIGAPDGRRLVAPFASLSARPGTGTLTLSGTAAPATESVPGPTSLLVRRDVLDAPVVLAVPPRRTRVSDVVIEVGPDGAHVVGVDLSTSGMLRRFGGRASSASAQQAVPLSEVHLISAHGHAAQLATPHPRVLTLPAQGMAEVLTRVPVAHARDIIHAADRDLREEAVGLLHPHVRARVTGSGGPPRRTRRLGGWRLHSPATHRRDGDRE